MLDLVTLHPKFVHFPIAFLMFSFIFEIFFILKNDLIYRKFSLMLLYIGFIGSLAALGSGLLAENALGHSSSNHDLIHDHRNIMVISTILWLIYILLTNLIKFLKDDKYKFGRLVLLTILFGTFYFGVHKGGELVYKYGVGISKEFISMPPSENINVPTKEENGHGDEHHHSH